MPRSAAVRQVCQGIHSNVWQGMRRYAPVRFAKVCQGMPRYAKVCQGTVLEYAEACSCELLRMSRYVKVC